MRLSDLEKETIVQTVRQVIYFVTIACGGLILRALTSHYRTSTFWEYGIVENIQLTLLLLTAGIFGVNAFVLKQNRGLFFFFMGLCLLASCRELDSYFGDRLPVIGWKFGYLFPLVGLGLFIRRKEEARKSFFHFLKTPAFQMMSLVIVMLLIAQILGHRPFIEEAYGKRIDSRAVRRIFEEGLECMAYLLLLLSAVECYFDFSKKK